MPRIAEACALVLGACSFDANYGGGRYTCSDGICPTGLVCSQGTCVTPGSGSGVDAAVDARNYALTCSDPEPIASTGGTFMGTTAGRSNLVTASCSGGIMNGPDAVYRYDATIGDQLTISIAASYAASVVVIEPCTPAPATPACSEAMAATPGNPLSLTAGFTGPHFIVVDGINPTMSGSYTLTVTR